MFQARVPGCLQVSRALYLVSTTPMCSLVFICNRMQCNVPADCWRLQTAEFAPAYAYEPRLLLKDFPGLAACVRRMRDEATYSIATLWKRADSLDNKSHTYICLCIDMRKSLTIDTRIQKDPNRYFKVRGHMMARTRSSHQTLKKRLMKHATPCKTRPKSRGRA